MRVLAIDIGGSKVKCLATGHSERRAFASGKKLTPKQMVSNVKALTRDWQYDVVSIGYPGLVTDGRPTTEPNNLGRGWVNFDYAAAFGCPVKILNDAAMQALGSYQGGLMLFVGLGTGLGSALISGDTVVPLEIGHLSYRKGTYEDHVGVRGLHKHGAKRWRRDVAFGVTRLMETMHPDDVVLGGGNSKKLKKLPPHCRTGDNSKAFLGGFRMWDEERPKKFQFKTTAAGR
jgi:polyphosphate glucokinase